MFGIPQPLNSQNPVVCLVGGPQCVIAAVDLPQDEKVPHVLGHVIGERGQALVDISVLELVIP